MQIAPLPHPDHAPGLETALLRRWPLALALGSLLPSLLAGLIWALGPDAAGVIASKPQLLAWFTLIGAVVFYWSMLMTVAIGCIVVKIMKGPVRSADAYPLPKPDRIEL